MCRVCDKTDKNYTELRHEFDRVHQFEAKARDDNHFRQLILNRASKCSPAKRERFVQTLREMEREDLAGFIEMCFKQRGEKNGHSA